MLLTQLSITVENEKEKKNRKNLYGKNIRSLDELILLRHWGELYERKRTKNKGKMYIRKNNKRNVDNRIN